MDEAAVDASGDLANSVEGVEELAPARDTTAKVDEASDTTNDRAGVENDASGDQAIPTKGVEEIAVARDTTTDEDEASDTTDEDDGEVVCADCGYQVSSLWEHEHCETIWECSVCKEEKTTLSEMGEHLMCEHKEYCETRAVIVKMRQL